MTDPIWIDCEGSGCPGHFTTVDDVVMCSMCGSLFRSNSRTVPDHSRLHVLAMLDRGDFDA